MEGFFYSYLTPPNTYMAGSRAAIGPMGVWQLPLHAKPMRLSHRGEWPSTKDFCIFDTIVCRLFQYIWPVRSYPLSPFHILVDKGVVQMTKRMPIFYSALMLTLVNLLLRFAGTSFQVYISASLGAAGVGLLQLVMSVGSLAIVAGMAGIRTATMYLTAEELGRGRVGNIWRVLSGCVRYSILCSGAVAAALYAFAPKIAADWIGNAQITQALWLFAAFLPVSCLCGVMTGCFTGANRIATLAAVEVAEQIASMAITLALLHFWAGDDSGRSCMSVILGSSFGALLTLLCLVFLRLRERGKDSDKIPIHSRLLQIAAPLAVADDLKAGINTIENLMVPKRLARCPIVADPLAAFGMLSGMVFPILMFPACILYSLAELLIPELARCAAAGSNNRIRYLSKRSLKIGMLYGLLFGGLEFLLAEELCLRLYHNPEAGKYLRLYALLIPMLYCDAITDAMSKGLGKQSICVRYNIVTAAMDVVFLYLLLPKYGMFGYFVSFFITHAVNFVLSLRLLLKTTGHRLPLHTPMLALAATIASVWAAMHLPSPLVQAVCYPLLLFPLLFLLQVAGKEDIHWLQGLIKVK